MGDLSGWLRTLDWYHPVIDKEADTVSEFTHAVEQLLGQGYEF